MSNSSPIAANCTSQKLRNEPKPSTRNYETNPGPSPLRNLRNRSNVTEPRPQGAICNRFVIKDPLGCSNIQSVNLQAVIFDWAGTLADHGSRAPVSALLSIFSEAGVPICVDEARLSMGLAKKNHIESILAIPRVKDAWTAMHGDPTQADADRLYANFIPQQLACLESHSDLIDGVPDAAQRLRERGIKIGTTTGYTRPMLDYLLGRARQQGFAPDFSTCPDEVPADRPAPYMCYSNAIRLQSYPLWAVVKIGDTPVDIEEGLNAGMWTVGITRTGNEVGLTKAEWEATPDQQKRLKLLTAEERLMAAGAHYVADSAANCDHIFDSIQVRLNRGERP
jgi:phosphonoacetaldehyde hydrolase